ncbi:serine hydrolase domain-containing protein [Streptomyces poriticola]|uniref:serine hydrolase domain-containing protein n=1 Tax=Streptomyces poriticola TaxID=3120506 RepID=UPI002FCE47F4
MKQKIHGTVADGFEEVREEFAALVAGGGPDHEGQVCAYLHGRRIVDLWAGDGGDGDSLYGVRTATQGAAHLVAALLVQDGTLELDRKVTYYWPEFAAEGKGGLTLRDLLAHRAGLVGTDSGFTGAELADDRVIAERLADQRPFWRPGTAFGHHTLVIGALTGEVVRRATGRTLQEVYEERVRAPHGLDLFLGLPPALDARYRTVQRAAPAAPPGSPHTLAAIALNRNAARPTDLAALPDEPLVRARGPASVGGTASARGLAGLYAAAIGERGGKAPLLKPDTVAEIGQVHATGRDLVARAHRSYGLGFEATADVWYPLLGAGAFGHRDGGGGCQGFADPRGSLAYACTRRRYSEAPPGSGSPEDGRLVAALCRAAAGR